MYAKSKNPLETFEHFVIIRFVTNVDTSKMNLKQSILALVSIHDASSALIEAVLSITFTPVSVVNEIAHLLNEGLIEKEEQKLSLSLIGLNELSQSVNFRNKGENWDGLFRFVTFNIPESQRGKRDKLRRQLKADGYRQFMGALWVNFFDTDLTIRLGQSPDYPFVEVMKGIRVTGRESDEELIKKIYSLDDLYRSYKDLNENWDKALSGSFNASKTARVAIHLLSEYLKLINMDNHVPDQIMPELGQSRKIFEENLWQLMNLGESFVGKN